MMSMILWLEMFEEPSKREGCSIGVGAVWRFVVVAMRPTVESHAYMLSRGSWKKNTFSVLRLAVSRQSGVALRVTE